MNASTSDYSSGCESGWTTYLDQISNSDPYSSRSAFYANNYQQKGVNDHVDDDEQEEEEEDLSMVSDASSAPPNYTYNYTYGYHYASEDKQQKQKKKSNNKSRKEPKQHQNLCLDVDDTASSSIFHFSQDNVPPPDDPNSVGHVYSAAHFQGETVTKKRLSFFKSSTKGKSSGSVVGRKRQ